MYNVQFNLGGYIKNYHVSAQEIEHSKPTKDKKGRVNLPFSRTTRLELNLTEEKLKALVANNKKEVIAKIIAYERAFDDIEKLNIHPRVLKDVVFHPFSQTGNALVIKEQNYIVVEPIFQGVEATA